MDNEAHEAVPPPARFHYYLVSFQNQGFLKRTKGKPRARGGWWRHAGGEPVGGIAGDSIGIYWKT